MSTEETPGEIVLLRLRDYDGLEAFGSRIDFLVESDVVRFVLDMDEVAVVNSTLLGFLVKTKKSLNARGGDLVLLRPTEFVDKTLRALALHEIFTISRDLEDAVSRL